MDPDNRTDNRTANRTPAEPLPHAGPGIASFAIAVAALVMVASAVAGFAFVDPDALFSAVNETMSDEELTKAILDEAPMLVIGSLLIVLASFLTFIGAALGVAGLLMPRRRRPFAVLGTVLNGAMVLLALTAGLLGFFGLFRI